MNTILITGGSGFIGTNLVNFFLKKKFRVINIDKKTYASNKIEIKNSSYLEYKLDINNKKEITNIIKKFKPKSIFHLAAETHVDNSILSPKIFITTNVLGTFSILESIRENISNKYNPNFIHVSTDEVYGDLLDRKILKSKESDKYMPSSPYSSSKASSDHLVFSWARTYGLNVVVTNCSNNFGPYQHKEKFIPTIINSIINKNKIPIYGDGNQVREWLFVEDHCRALYMMNKNFKSNEQYNIGAKFSYSNLDLVKKICNIYDNKISKKNFNSTKLIKFVKDRKGHDKKYSLNITKIKNQIKWIPNSNIDQNLFKTILWFMS